MPRVVSSGPDLATVTKCNQFPRAASFSEVAESGNSYPPAELSQYVYMGFANAESQPAGTHLTYRISKNIGHYLTLLLIQSYTILGRMELM